MSPISSQAFRGRKRDDWRKMLAVSVEWCVADSFHSGARCTRPLNPFRAPLPPEHAGQTCQRRFLNASKHGQPRRSPMSSSSSRHALLEKCHLCTFSFGRRHMPHLITQSSLFPTTRSQRLARTLGETDKEISGYKKLFEEFLATPDEEWEARNISFASALAMRPPAAYLNCMASSIGCICMRHERLRL